MAGNGVCEGFFESKCEENQRMVGYGVQTEGLGRLFSALQATKIHLDTAQKLLRRGFQHAAKCAEVSLKRLKLGGINCSTGFTLSLVNMRNPMDILTKNQVRTC